MYLGISVKVTLGVVVFMTSKQFDIKKHLSYDLYTFRQKLIDTYPINKRTDKKVEELLLKINDELLMLEDIVDDWEL